MFYALVILAAASLIIAIYSAVKNVPAILWISVVLLSILELLHVLPAH